MFLNIRDMEVRPLVFDLSFSPGEIDFLDEGLTQAGVLRVEGRAEWLGSVEEVRVRGQVWVEMSGVCERCLEPAPLRVERSFDLFYRPEGSTPEAGEVALKEGEIEIGFYEGDGLDLTEILREQVLLALPMQRLCQADCRGLCPVCGADRNRQSCSCATEIADERWAALKDFAAPR